MLGLSTEAEADEGGEGGGPESDRGGRGRG